MIKKQKGLLYDYIKNPIDEGLFSIQEQKNKNFEGWVLYKKTSINNKDVFIYNGDDSNSFVQSHFSELFNIEFSSILIGGLGLGILPYKLKNFCKIIDVVEIDSDIIKIVNNINHLSEVNIVNEDIYNYQPKNNYDAIVIDIWDDDANPCLEKEIQICVEKYTTYLNKNGFLYFPIKKLKGKTIYK